MKKILSILGLAGLALTGCVDDNPSVIFNGFVEADSCSASGGDQVYITGRTCNPSSDVNFSPYMTIDIHMNNYITGEPPWSSSGSGSGTTFEPETINPGMIFFDRIVVGCYSIDGDTDACQDIEPFTYEFSSPLQGNGSGFCLWNFSLDYSTVASWGGSTVVLDLYAEYHDASLMKGKTSHAKFNLTFITSTDPTSACSYIKPKEDGSSE